MFKVTIKNPEAIENACKNYTTVMIKLYNEGKIKIPVQKVATMNQLENRISTMEVAEMMEMENQTERR